MGYYSDITMETLEGEDFSKVYAYLEQYDPENPLLYAVDQEGNFANEIKWYDDQDCHMKKLSLLFPDTLFKVYGEGEANDDMWVKYYKNGKMQICPAIITYEEYDAAKLE